MANPDTLNQLWKDKELYIEGSLSRFDSGLRKLQEELFDQIMTEYIPQFDVKEGVILLTEKNARLSAELGELLDKFKEQQALSVFKTLGNNMISTMDLTSDYYRKMTGATAKIKSIEKSLKGYSALIGIDSKGGVIANGFIDNLADAKQMKDVLSNYVVKSLEGQVGHRDFVKGFKDLIKGAEGVNGVYERYAGNYASDIYFSQAQMQDNYFAEQLGLDHFTYVGETVKDSRPFCIERHGQTYTKDEGVAWNQLEWKGKIPGVDFFVQRGGYNCRHHIRWVTEEEYNADRGIE